VSSAEYNHNYYVKHRDSLLPKLRIRAAKWQKNNKERRNANDRERRRLGLTPNPSAQRRYRDKLRAEAMKAYGGKCKCCGESVDEFLTIDHVNGGGTKHRKAMKRGGGVFFLWLKQNGYPKDFRILCWNCNWSTHRGNGICYHKRLKDRLADASH
jgi:hypothetical protein